MPDDIGQLETTHPRRSVDHLGEVDGVDDGTVVPVVQHGGDLVGRRLVDQVGDQGERVEQHLPTSTVVLGVLLAAGRPERLGREAAFESQRPARPVDGVVGNRLDDQPIAGVHHPHPTAAPAATHGCGDGDLSAL